MKTFSGLVEELKQAKRKPKLVNYFQYKGNNDEIPSEISNHKMFKVGKNGNPYIQTLEGKMNISVNDFIVIGVKDDMFPVKPDIFKLNYDLV